MTRISVDISRLPKDVFTYTNERFYTFIENFCGKDEADLLSIQSIRSVDSFLSIEDAYSIFALDSDDVKEIQTRCGFKNRNGIYTVRPGIKSSLDYVKTLLKEMQKKVVRTKRMQPTLFQSTGLYSSFSSNNLSNVNTTAGLSVSEKDEDGHRDLIENSIQDWCIQNKNTIKIPDSNLISGVHYHLKFTSSLDKAEIKCSCGLVYILLRAESGNFKLSNYFRHLKSGCLMVQTEVMNDSIGDTTQDDTQDSTSISSLQQISITSVRKRTRRSTSKHTTTKKIRTA
ncbi:unnamed protein product [Rotaria sordida]|uniref:Uncharacterized protein n=1 Tax=Rotaria sordida TaxID=392033 RepID=A0A814TQF2_9BILA|nr:unnamed protein product [Rotaria sordida]CAF4096368.1 unnamed protein product [Rotaria sordida]